MVEYKLDITKDHCPMTFAKTKIQLAKIASGDILEVTLNEGEPLDNVPRSAAEEGHIILEKVEIRKGVYRIKIQKK